MRGSSELKVNVYLNRTCSAWNQPEGNKQTKNNQKNNQTNSKTTQKTTKKPPKKPTKKQQKNKRKIPNQTEFKY